MSGDKRTGWFNALVNKKKARTWRESLGFCVGCGVGLIAFYVLLTIGHYYNDGWGPNQWGSVASWVSGLATFFAVGVALYQTKLARDDASHAKKDAIDRIALEEARHTADLVAADKRLAHELDSARRLEQLKTIPPIWDAIGDLTTHWIDYREALNAAPYLASTDEAVAEWRKQIDPWLDSLKAVELVFTTPMMIVSEPNTQGAITELYEKVRKLQTMSVDLVGVAFKTKKPVDLGDATALVKSINTSRKPMTSIVRQYLTEAPPLRPSDERGQ
ncbi:hypothetical protein CH304_19605 [Rhodococcus sp. 15-649-1-2]|nr:hypothetical protein CH304_19605 [Rhodococcus sp. 15-649-1-2]